MELKEVSHQEIFVRLAEENGFDREEAKTLSTALECMGFFEAPASTKYHGNHPGGLFNHCLNVYYHLKDMTDCMGLKWSREESVFVVAFLHDLCKCDCYIQQEDGTYTFNKTTLLTGHGIKSAILAQKALADVRGLYEEEMACIVYHMGAFTEKEEWGTYTNAIHKFENVLWTHQADMLAAHVDMT